MLEQRPLLARHMELISMETLIYKFNIVGITAKYTTGALKTMFSSDYPEKKYVTQFCLCGEYLYKIRFI